MAGSLPEPTTSTAPKSEALACGHGFTIRRHSEYRPLLFLFSPPCPTAGRRPLGCALFDNAPRNAGRRPRISVVHAGRHAADERGGLLHDPPAGTQHHAAEISPSVPNGASGSTSRRSSARRTGRHIAIYHPAVRPSARTTAADRDREHALALHEQQEKIRIKKQHEQHQPRTGKTPVARCRVSGNLDNQGLSGEAHVPRKALPGGAAAQSACRHLDRHAHGRGEPADPQGRVVLNATSWTKSAPTCSSGPKGSGCA